MCTSQMKPNKSYLYPNPYAPQNPHQALCDATTEYYKHANNIDKLKDLFRHVIDGGQSGFEYRCSISCLFEDETMQRYGIDAFSDMERCIVGSTDHDLPWITYSLPEIEGWFVLLSLSIANKFNADIKYPLLAMLGRRYNIDERLATLYNKLSGLDDWDHGPVESTASKEYIANWHSLHTKQLANEYFEPVDTDFLENSPSMTKLVNSSIDTGPKIENLFPKNSKYTNPHIALTDTLSGFLFLIEDVDTLVSAINTLLDGNNLSFPELGDIVYTYNEQWIINEGIDTFNANEYCIAKSQNTSKPKWIKYSMAEIEGWVTLVAINLARKRIGNRKQKIDKLLESRFNTHKRLDQLRGKLSGNSAWDHGPVGHDATAELIKNWQNLHCAGLEADIYEHNRTGNISIL